MKIKGVKIKMGDGVEYLVPSLTLGQAQSFNDLMNDLNAKATDPMRVTAGFDISAQWIPIIAAAMQRNYPNMTVEEVADIIDLNDFDAIRQIVLGHRKGEAVLGEETPPTV